MLSGLHAPATVATADWWARGLALASFVVAAAALLLEYWRHRRRVLVDLRGGMSAGPDPFSYAQVFVTSIGRRITVENVSLKWADPKPMPHGFGTRGLTAADFGWADGAVPGFWLYMSGVREEPGPPWVQVHLEDGVTEVIPIGRITFRDPDWGKGLDHLQRKVSLRAAVSVVGRKKPYLSKAKPFDLRPPSLSEIIGNTSDQESPEPAE